MSVLRSPLVFLVRFYGTKKVQLVGSSSSSTIAPIIDGDLLVPQAKRFKEIMRDTVCSVYLGYPLGFGYIYIH